MVIGNGIDYKVTVSRHFIENGMIKIVDNEKSENLKFINLKVKSNNETPIFMDFISIDIQNQNNINEVRKMQYVIQLNEFATCYYSDDKFSDSYNEMYHKTIIALQELLLFEDAENLSDTGKSIKYKHKDAIRKIDPDVLHEFICTVMLKQINSCLLSIFPQMNLGIDGYERHFLGYWKAPTLLNAMYYELFLKISENKKIRKCQNSTCLKYFEIIGNDTRKIYCDRYCASLQAKRKERARNKLKASKGEAINHVEHP